MPPQRAAPRRSEDVWLFKKAHPFATFFLINSARLTQPLLILTMLVNSSLLRRWGWSVPPKSKVRIFFWYLAYVSFFSRHLLALLSVTWLFRTERGLPGEGPLNRADDAVAVDVNINDGVPADANNDPEARVADDDGRPQEILLE